MDSVEEVVRATLERWPTLGPARSELSHLIAADAPWSEEFRQHWADRALAKMCAAGIRPAIEIFDSDFASQIPEYIARLRLDAHVVDEVCQTVRINSLTGSPAILTQYTGRGSLGAWLRVVTVRTALNLVALQKRAPSSPGKESMEEAFAASLQVSKDVPSHEKKLFEQALQKALAELPAEDKVLLRMASIDGVSIDGLAAFLGVHRATAARKIVAIRNRVHDAVQNELSSTVRLPTRDLQSLVASIASKVDIDLDRDLR